MLKWHLPANQKQVFSLYQQGQSEVLIGASNLGGGRSDILRVVMKGGQEAMRRRRRRRRRRMTGSTHVCGSVSSVVPDVVHQCGEVLQAVGDVVGKQQEAHRLRRQDQVKPPDL